MSEKEKQMISKINALPEKLQEKIPDKIDGATMAIEMLSNTAKKEDDEREP